MRKWEVIGEGGKESGTIVSSSAYTIGLKNGNYYFLLGITMALLALSLRWDRDGA